MLWVVRSHAHSRAHTHSHTHLHARAHAHTHARTHICTRANAHTAHAHVAGSWSPMMPLPSLGPSEGRLLGYLYLRRAMGRGVLSSSRGASTSEERSPVKIAASTAAPSATASFGLIDLRSACQLKNSWTMGGTLGIRMGPPTSATTCPLRLCIPLSQSYFTTGPMRRQR